MKQDAELGDYPPKPPVQQLELSEVRKLKPEAVEAARKAGALDMLQKFGPKWRREEG